MYSSTISSFRIHTCNALQIICTARMSDSFRHSSVESHFFIILFLKCFAKVISAHTYLRKNELHSVRTSWTVKNAMSRATSGAIYDTSDRADCI